MTLERFWKSAAAVFFVVTTLGIAPASAAGRGRVYVRAGPPVAVVERRPVAPGRNDVWVPGFHRWRGAAYVWVPGAWQLPPRPRAVFAPGHWSHDRHGWLFVEGRWR